MDLLLKAMSHFIAAKFWDKVSDVYLFAGNIARKHNYARGMYMSGRRGHIACQKAIANVKELKKIIGMINSQ